MGFLKGQKNIISVEKGPLLNLCLSQDSPNRLFPRTRSMLLEAPIRLLTRERHLKTFWLPRKVTFSKISHVLMDTPLQ